MFEITLNVTISPVRGYRVKKRLLQIPERKVTTASTETWTTCTLDQLQVQLVSSMMEQRKALCIYLRGITKSSLRGLTVTIEGRIIDRKKKCAWKYKSCESKIL